MKGFIEIKIDKGIRTLININKIIRVEDYRILINEVYEKKDFFDEYDYERVIANRWIDTMETFEIIKKKISEAQ